MTQQKCKLFNFCFLIHSSYIASMISDLQNSCVIMRGRLTNLNSAAPEPRYDTIIQKCTFFLCHALSIIQSVRNKDNKQIFQWFFFFRWGLVRWSINRLEFQFSIQPLVRSSKCGFICIFAQ